MREFLGKTLRPNFWHLVYIASLLILHIYVHVVSMSYLFYAIDAKHFLKYPEKMMKKYERYDSIFRFQNCFQNCQNTSLSKRIEYY